METDEVEWRCPRNGEWFWRDDNKWWEKAVMNFSHHSAWVYCGDGVPPSGRVS